MRNKIVRIYVAYTMSEECGFKMYIVGEDGDDAPEI